MMRSVLRAAPADGSGAKVRRHGLGAFAAVLFALLGLLGVPGAASAQLTTDPGTVIQTIDTSLWTPPSPDPAGITYLPETGELVTCDSEVDEMPTLFTGVNLWYHSNTGAVSSTSTTLPPLNPYSNEPAGIAFDPAGGRAWIADDNAARIFEVEFGADGVFGTPDDFVDDLDGISAAGCVDIEDVTYNSLDGHLYIAGGLTGEVCEIDPGPDGVFNGALPTGDDIVTTFSLAAYGIYDIEGIVYDPFWNTLVVADRKGLRDLYELTPEGGLLRRIDVNFPGGHKPSGVTIAPGSTNPSLRNYYVTDRRLDNLTDPTENDGRIYEVVAIPLGGNGAPVVDAGAPQTLEWPDDSVQLDGFVNDDGHPYPPSTVLAQWSQLEGPGSVIFGDASAPQTTATFSTPGEYLLQLLGDDSAAQTTDTVAITVNHTVTLSVATTGPGSVTLDPPGGSYPAGTSVTVTATPDADSAFLGFGGDLSGTTNPQLVVMDASKSATASFATLYDVTIQVTGPGTVTLDPPGGTYAAGTVVSVTATPDAGAVFDGFGGSLAGTESPQLLSVDGDEIVSASFTQHYTLSASSTGPGTVTLDPPGGSYPAGTSVTVTAVPDLDAAFTGWSGDLAGTTSPETVLVDAAKSVTASFAALYDVSIQSSGPGTVTLDPPGGTYAAGTVVSVAATPDAGAVFDGFGGSLAGTESPQLLSVDGDEIVTASFTQHYTLSASGTGPGTVTLDPPGGSYPAGTSVTVTAVPDLDAAFTGWSGDLAGTTNPETVVMDAAKSVTASFATLHDVSVEISGPGSVTLDPPGGAYPAGTVVSVTATPDAGALFQGFGGSLAGTDSPQLLTVDGDETVTASFEAPSYTLNVTTVSSGTVSIDPPTGPYPAGTTVTLTAVPSTGYLFVGWAGDATGSENPLLLVMDADKAVEAQFKSAGGGGTPTSCGIGPELVAAVPLLAWLHGRRRRAPRRPL
jgi:hypothetical protein